MNGLSEKLGIGPEVRELKFGQSFTSGKGGSFHTIRYDFKPASVDPTKMATLDVNNSQVTISMQNTDMTSTVFTGPRKPYGKECVLIIDPETGECVLEKLTHSIQVKKTRQEGASRISNKSLPPAPAPPPEIKKHHIVTGGLSSSQNYRTADSKSSNHDKSKSSKTLLPSTSSNSLSTPSNPTQRRPHSPMLSVPTRHSPLSTSPGRLSPNNGTNNVNAFDALLSNHSKQSKQQLHQQHHQPPPQQQQQQSLASLMPSLTNFEDLLAGTGTSSSSSSSSVVASGNSPATLSTSSSSSFRGNSRETSSMSKNSPHQSVIPPPPLPTTGIGLSSTATALSESSSGDSSSSSISSSDDDESSDEDMEVVPDMTEISMPSMPMIPISTTTFSSSSSPLSAAKSTAVPPINRSMPSHLLSEDLQLSESCSDSD